MGGAGRWRKQVEQMLVEPFRLISATLLSLLLPLSFLLLSRLSSARFFLSFATSSSPPPPPLTSSFFSVFHYTNPALLYGAVSFISIYTLVHGLTTKITAGSERSIIFYPRVGIAWLTLFLLQVSVGLGLEGTVSEGITAGIIVGKERNFLSRIVFFLGLHEAMLLWYRMIVRPVVDDALTEEGYRRREETVVERVALAVSCGTLWWWKLRDEVEVLVGVAEAKRELVLWVEDSFTGDGNVDVGMVDFVNWWLYYLVVTIGMVRAVKGLLWIGMILLFERVRRNPDETVSTLNQNGFEEDDKV